MTQPEETTAVKKTTVNINIMDAPQVEQALSNAAAMVAWARAERDEARADYHKVVARNDELLSASHGNAMRAKAAEKERDEQRARAEKAEAELRSKQSLSRCLDEDNRELRKRAETAEAKVRHLWCDQPEFKARIEQLTSELAAAGRMLAERTRERDEARADCNHNRELLGKELARGRILQNERDETREQLAKVEWAGPWRNAAPELPGYDRGPAAQTCIECGGVKPEKRILGNFPAADIGHRPTCWFAKKGAGKEGAKPPTPREQWKTKQAHYDYWLDAPGASFVYEPSSGIWKLVDKPSGRPARPEPRFKVGEKVVADAHGKTWTGVIERPRIDGGAWFYDVRCANSVILSGEESQIKPAPKFAVGEWVEWMSAPVSEGGRICSGPVLRRWFADLTNDGWWYEVPWRIRESDLTAQTPQHKHDCKGCVFLGRWDRFDLYFCKDGEKQLGYRYGEHRLDIGWDEQSGAGVEARRRAVARGLAK